MRSLFFKIFVIFWIAQSLIFVISTALIISHRVPRPEFLLGALSNDLRRESSDAASAFESGGCAALTASSVKHESNFVLEDTEGKALCASSIPPSFPVVAAPANQITSTLVNDKYVWTVPVTSQRGIHYIFVLAVPGRFQQHSWYDDLLHFAFPQLPAFIAVGGSTTFVLVLLFTRPVVRLRRAARELAQGNLCVRVQEAPSRMRIFQGDEFQALIRDFNHMAERLQSLVDAQKLLLRDVSHELRSPLARLSVALELSREDADQGMSRHLDRIQREADRLNQLIGQLLTLSSMEAIEAASTFKPVSLQGLIEQMIPDAEYEASQRQCSIAFHSGDECMVRGNRELLYRAIENVLRNAIRYTDLDTEVSIQLTAAENETGRAAILDVSDHGPGIPESEIKAIFRPFYRVDHARSSETGGFGVGLAIAERTVKLHNGELHAFNHNGAGVTFRMQFPITNQIDEAEIDSKER
jgi:two-component system sensor histidine kinase CpxA